MRINEIRNFPTTIDNPAPGRGLPSGWHESLLRSYQIVQKVRELLEKKTPTEVILELIDTMEEK